MRAAKLAHHIAKPRLDLHFRSCVLTGSCSGFFCRFYVAVDGLKRSLMGDLETLPRLSLIACPTNSTFSVSSVAGRFQASLFWLASLS